MAVEMQKIPVDDADTGSRLDRFIRRYCAGINQGRIEKLLRAGAIRIDGARAKSNARVESGQMVTMPRHLTIGEGNAAPPRMQSAAPSAAVIETLRDAVIARGDGWLAINKPSGLASQGGTKIRNHIDGALQAAFPIAEGEARLVHRLDRDTSGVMVVALSLPAARELGRGFKSGAHAKTYLALARGAPKAASGIIDAPLVKAGGRGFEKMRVDENGTQAQTQYRVLESFGHAASLVALRPLTGRTHQLRAHMAAAGTPILGDGKYGGREAYPHADITRLCLHAARLELQSGEVITAEIPADLRGSFALFGIDPDDALRRIGDENLFTDGGGA